MFRMFYQQCLIVWQRPKRLQYETYFLCTLIAIDTVSNISFCLQQKHGQGCMQVVAKWVNLGDDVNNPLSFDA